MEQSPQLLSLSVYTDIGTCVRHSVLPRLDTELL